MGNPKTKPSKNLIIDSVMLRKLRLDFKITIRFQEFFASYWEVMGS